MVAAIRKKAVIALPRGAALSIPVVHLQPAPVITRNEPLKVQELMPLTSFRMHQIRGDNKKDAANIRFRR